MWRRAWSTLVVCLGLMAGLGAMPDAPVAHPSVGLKARTFRPGELLIVTVQAPNSAQAVGVRVFDRDVPATQVKPGQWEAIAGIDLDCRPGAYDVQARVDGVEAHAAVEVLPRAFRVRVLKVDPDFVNPPAAAAARIAAESELVTRAFETGADERLWSRPFLRPVPQRANSSFGTRSIFNGEPRNAHGGTDFLSPSGTPVLAPNDGRVSVARPLYFAGGSVVVDHGAGVFSQMAHLSRIDVTEGQVVRRGQVLGLVGATGRVTGAHLHWAVRAAGARVDALSLLAMLGAPAPRQDAARPGQGSL